MSILTVKEVADLLKIKTSTVYAWAEQRKIPCYRLNGSLRFHKEDLTRWLEVCKQPEEGYNTSRR